MEYKTESGYYCERETGYLLIYCLFLCVYGGGRGRYSFREAGSTLNLSHLGQDSIKGFRLGYRLLSEIFDESKLIFRRNGLPWVRVLFTFPVEIYSTIFEEAIMKDGEGSWMISYIGSEPYHGGEYLIGAEGVNTSRLKNGIKAYFDDWGLENTAVSVLIPKILTENSDVWPYKPEESIVFEKWYMGKVYTLKIILPSGELPEIFYPYYIDLNDQNEGREILSRLLKEDNPISRLLLIRIVFMLCDRDNYSSLEYRLSKYEGEYIPILSRIFTQLLENRLR